MHSLHIVQFFLEASETFGHSICKPHFFILKLGGNLIPSKHSWEGARSVCLLSWYGKVGSKALGYFMMVELDGLWIHWKIKVKMGGFLRNFGSVILEGQ